MRRVVQRLSLLSVLLTAVCASGQTGHWVSHPDDVVGFGGTIIDCGGTTAVYTDNEAARILFFDTIGGAWVGYDRPARETWHYVVAEGDLVLAVADTVAVAYNALTSTSHELFLEGTLLRNETNYWSFRCGRSLAYVATDEYFYVFDADLDAWQQTAVATPVDLVRSHSGVGDDWAGLTLERTYGEAAPCYAYSGTAHAFAFTDNGPLNGPLYQGALNHGFAEYNNVSTAMEMVAYSAVTNAFTRVAIPASFSQLQYGSSDDYKQEVRTTFAVVYRSGATFRHHFYGYDTRLGAWTESIIDYDNAEYSYWHNLEAGGQYAITTMRVLATGQIGFRVYSGIDGTITTHWPGVTGTSFSDFRGGTVYLATWAGVGAWGLDIPTGNSSFYALPADRYVGLRTRGEHFCAFSVWDYVDPNMDIVAYYGPTNSWSSGSNLQVSTLDLNCSPHCMVYAHLDVDIPVTFFSGHLGVFNNATLTNPGTFNYWWSDNLGCATNGNGDVAFYDARRDQVTLRSLDYDYDGLGQDVFVAADPATQLGWGYSAVSGLWTSVDIGETPRAGKAGVHVGWVGTPWRSARYWAFNGFYDEWVEVDVGAGRGEAVGDQTILVYNLVTVWAFDPESPIVPNADPGETPPPVIVPHEPALHPARPNPFNPETTVAFDLPLDGHVRLNAFDVRGRKVRELANGPWSAGTHEVKWDGRDDTGRSLPSGTYLLRLETARRVAAQRVMLVK
ncbi:MAG: hypothetical protein GY838_17090 [bacterium]|nr:hypothetical protein [bacterium]